MADNRSALKAGLGSEFFSADMWCTSPEQICLSNYIKTLESSATASATASPGPRLAASPSAVQRIQAVARGKQARHEVAKRASSRGDPAPARTVGAGTEADAPLDATDEVWEERIRGVRRAYVDSCSRLTDALGELEATLCGLTGDEYRPDQPLLHARAHMQRKLEMLSGRA